MAVGKGSPPAIIIKRSVESGEAGHHGGAWKVAYADFVTAMMAFFLLMWLLNATTEKQRTGLAEYFNPTLVRTPGASGDGVEAGMRSAVVQDLPDSEKAAEFDDISRRIQNQLSGTGAESMQMTNLLRHVVTRMTDEGLVIELSDLTEQPLFMDDTAQPQPALEELARIIARVLGQVRNQIAIAGHVRAYPEMLVTSPVWALSDARAHAVRNLLERGRLDPQRIQRVTGYADRKNRSANPMDPVNNRIELILLR
ncbi:MAG: flagellar motor protein MotB [Paracoccus sp. (in: a-proteobacteria)]|jgi:chemotaxis protein MotB|uniref:flagellar motor protein MotB n=2 Tax=Paracoccus TaxID=265 RepID=UPI000C5E519C|nr:MULTISPECIES: flagellar motor protein MotB [unclassified Paracoccus (in: a-proteobacteria)]MAN55703.1 chemotaxis protein MotB [Paracoccus sp. (in: a-proteobacteria)]MBA47803.1 chemotaxis protein MotB [Paracoccus sp. (in: a-proteobacteria)]MDB2490142.1 OmpA family protein [Paracoccus sp. (in: a-proteobacteria)]MDB2551730.1 OmpA family protein [Paracoccus sp. (in: a-proteobacteria)]|tara:strand:+ start:12734 stop:13495 length:762 start_codon:yes stop_codon:yes gene_type:complete